MTHIIQFIQAHLKSIVTVGFVCGLVSLVLKVLDEKLSEDQKKRFDAWVIGSAQGPDLLQLRDMHRWARDNRGLYVGSLIIVGILTPLVWGRHGDHFAVFHGLYDSVFHAVTESDPNPHLDWQLLTVSVIGVCWILSILFKLFDQFSPSQGFVEHLELLYTLGLWVVVFGIARFIFAVRSLPGPWTQYWWMFFQDTGRLVKYLVAFGLLTYLPMILLVVLRMPFAVVSKAVWWLATYPKGPWAGLVFATTIGLGILRLFM